MPSVPASPAGGGSSGRPFESAASALVSENAHPMEQLESLEEKAGDLSALGDLDAVIECRIKQLCLHKVLVHLHGFPKPDIVRAEVRLAEAYGTGGYHQQARDHLEKADQESRMGVFDATQCQRLQVDMKLAEGVVGLSEGQLDAAERCLTEASQLSREAYGEMDSRSGRLHTLLGKVAFQRKNYIEAVDHYSAAWQVFEAASGPDCEDAIDMWLRIAETEHAAGDPDRAIATQSKAVEKLRRVNTLPALTVDAMAQLARWLEGLGRDNDAMEQLQNAERTVAENLGPEDPKAIDIKRDLALLHLKLGENDVALQYLNDVHYYERRLHGSQSPGVARTLKALGTVHYVRRNFAEAERCLLQALHIFEGDQPQSAAMIRDIKAKLKNMTALMQQEANAQGGERAPRPGS